MKAHLTTLNLKRHQMIHIRLRKSLKQLSTSHSMTSITRLSWWAARCLLYRSRYQNNQTPIFQRWTICQRMLHIQCRLRWERSENHLYSTMHKLNKSSSFLLDSSFSIRRSRMIKIRIRIQELLQFLHLFQTPKNE